MLLQIPDFRCCILRDGVKAFPEGSETPFRAAEAQPRSDPQFMLPPIAQICGVQQCFWFSPVGLQTVVW